MSRAAPVVALALLVVGCARQPRPPADREADQAFAAARPAAAALVFEPALVREGPPVELSRDGRQPEAFVGYAEGVAEYFYVRWDDRQGNWGTGRHGGGFDRFERRAVSEKVGALYR